MAARPGFSQFIHSIAAAGRTDTTTRFRLRCESLGGQGVTRGGKKSRGWLHFDNDLADMESHAL